MIRIDANPWQIVVAVVLVIAVIGLVLWLVFRKRPTAAEIERARRQFLTQHGRILDGMLLDLCEIDMPVPSGEEGGPKRIMLHYNYRFGGVDYECAQDITDLGEIVDFAQIRVGFPCSARYQPGNPQNSIVLAEGWSGLRAGVPVLPTFHDPDLPKRYRSRPAGN